jgi:Gas vesicle protein K
VFVITGGGLFIADVDLGYVSLNAIIASARPGGQSPVPVPGRWSWWHGDRLSGTSTSTEKGRSDPGSLVLTVAQLVRQLMERHPIRRIDQGDLTLDEQMARSREHFGLAPEDLNLDLGRLGPLLPRDFQDREVVTLGQQGSPATWVRPADETGTAPRRGRTACRG